MEPNQEYTLNEPTLRDLFNLIRRGLVFALSVAIAAAALTYFLSHRAQETFQATATLLASQPDAALQSFGVSLVTAPTVDVSAYQAAVTSRPVLQNALLRLGEDAITQEQLAAMRKDVSVRVESGRQSSLIHIDVRHGDPVVAANSANALSSALLDWDKQRATRNLENIITALEGQISSLDSELQQVEGSATADPGQVDGLRSLKAEQTLQLNAAKALRNSAVGHLEIMEPAVVPLRPVAPRPARNAALAFVLGVFLVYGLLLLRDALDTRFKGTQDLADQTGLPVMAEFPRLAAGMRHLPREAANYLRTNVLFATSADDPKVILITSAGANQGKSSIAISLAESFARNHYHTLLIDADLRKPIIGKDYNLNGVTDVPLRRYLEAPDDPYEPITVPVDGGGTLDVIPSFSAAPSPTELLAGGFSRLLGRVKARYDVIVVDSPPVLPVADSLTMAPHTTGVLFAASLPDTDRRSVNASLALLERLGVRVLGLVATNLENARNGRGEYGYGYGYGYGPTAADAPATKTVTAAPVVSWEPATTARPARDPSDPVAVNARRDQG